MNILFEQKSQSSQLIKTLIFIGLMLSVAVYQQLSHAQRVQPMVFELEPVGSKSSTSLRIENTRQVPITVEFVANKMTMDELGNETLLPADEDFIIYPPQALIQPGKTQIARVRYIGEPLISMSQAYRISVKQLPVNLNKTGVTGVAMLLNFNTLVNIVPSNVQPELSVSKIEVAPDSKWFVTIKNQGNRFARLSKTTWEIVNKSDQTNKVRLKPMQVGEITNKNLILPNSEVRQLIPEFVGFDPLNTEISIFQK